MDKQQILNETVFNEKCFQMKNATFVLPEFSQNHHLVYLSENIKDNCFIKDESAADVLDCPNCKRIAKYAGGGLLEEKE